MITRVAAALIFGLPALYRIWYFRDQLHGTGLAILLVSLGMLTIAAGLLLRKKWGYHAARIWLLITLSLAGIGLLIFPHTESEGMWAMLFFPRALGVVLLTVLFSGWMLFQLSREQVKKEFGIS